MSIIGICYAAKNAQFSSGRVDENKRAAKSLESFHCKTSFRLREKRGREGEHLSLSLSEMAEEERRERDEAEEEEAHTTGNGFRKLGERRTTTTATKRGKLEQTLSAERRGKRERDRSEETEKGGNSDDKYASEREDDGARKGEMKCNGRTGYRKLKLNQEIPSNVVPHPFQRAQGNLQDRYRCK